MKAISDNRWIAPWIVAAAVVFCMDSACAVNPVGIVFEAEHIASPRGWLRDGRASDRWTLWTQEADIDRKRSRGAVLASPPVTRDRANPEEGAPPLHCVVTNLVPGAYSIFLSPPGRPLAYSLNGTDWFKYKGGERNLGIHDLNAGNFEFWIDDRYAHPAENPGAGYFDYVRFVRVEPEALLVERDSPWPGMDAAANRQPHNWIVPAKECSLDGFEPDGKETARAAGPPAKMTYVFERSGKFHVAILMGDDRDGIEYLDVLLNGRRIGLVCGDWDTDARALFRLKKPIEVKIGDELTLAPRTPVGMYRVDRLIFGSGPLVPPPLKVDHFEVWNPEPGATHLCWTTSRPVESQRLLLSSVSGTVHQMEIARGLARNHRAILTGLDPAVAYDARIQLDLNGRPIESPRMAVSAAAPQPRPTTPHSIRLAVTEPADTPRPTVAAVTGLPFAVGKLRHCDDLRLFSDDGKAVTLQADATARWRDGSVKFATLSFPATPGTHYQLEARDRWPDHAAALKNTVDIHESSDAWHIGGIGLHFDLNKKVPALFQNVAFDHNGDGQIGEAERISAQPMLANLRLETGDGINLTCGTPRRLDIECNGAVRSVLRWEGPLVDAKGNASWGYVIRASLYAGIPEMRLAITIINDNPQPRYRPVRMVALRLPIEGRGGSLGSVDGKGDLRPIGETELVVQQDDESRAQISGAERISGRMAGVAVVGDKKSRVLVAMRDFWQAYPSGYAIRPDGLHIRLLPPLATDAYGDAGALDALRLFGWCRDGAYLFKAGQAMQKEIVIRYGPAEDKVDPAQFAKWAQAPLIPQAPPEYLCGSGLLSRPIFASPADRADAFDQFFEKGFGASIEDRQKQRSFGWMHFGDWFGERLLNYGNNEYDMPWAMALQWARAGDRRYFDRGLEMARHHSTIDTVHGSFADAWNGLVYEHSFNHVGLDISPDDPRLKEGLLARYISEYGAMLGGAIDRQGHVFQAGNWIYATLAGDGWLREVAKRISDNQADRLTRNFDFSIERAGGWPIINMSMAYHFTGDPYYLNAARIMVERALDRQDPESGGWLHWHAGGESGGEQGMGGKAFAVGILTHGLLRYLEQEPAPRPDVERMLVRAADFLKDHAWVPGKGFRYISHLKYHADRPARGGSEGLNAELVAFAYERTRDERYRALFNDMLEGFFDRRPSGNGKAFTMQTRQTIYGIDRMRAIEKAQGGTPANGF